MKSGNKEWMFRSLDYFLVNTCNGWKTSEFSVDINEQQQANYQILQIGN